MNYRMIIRYLAFTLLITAAFMLPALVISLCLRETRSAMAFGVCILVLVAVCVPIAVFRPKRTVMRAREGYIITGLCWFLVSMAGAAPFVISGCIPSFTDALFEAASGFTTTGASILSDLDPLPKGILYWRSFSHWLGGMGVLVFLLALSPSDFNGDSLFIMRAESPGPQVSKLVPKTRQSAQILYKIYVGMTAAEILMLLLGGMEVFDAVTISFATAGTGGFAVRSSGMASYTPYMQWVIASFMVLFGVNFGIYYLCIMRSFKRIRRNDEMRVYLALVVLSTLVITLRILPMYQGDMAEASRHAFFQVASIISTTGFASADFNVWPTVCKTILVVLMFIGASAGSTAGGVKVSRLVILAKSLRQNMKKLLHPNTVSKVHMDGDVVSDSTVNFVFIYFAAYVFILLISLLVVSWDGLSFEATVTGVLACLNNVGPGLGEVGPLGNYASLGIASKICLTLDMIIGRLEIFPVLMLLLRSNWKRSRIRE